MPAAKLNAQARHQAAYRAWVAISRFYANGQAKVPGKKGYPRFHHDCRSVEYKGTGGTLDPDGKQLTFSDGHRLGRLRLAACGLRLVGTRAIEEYPVEHIKRVRVVRRADG